MQLTFQNMTVQNSDPVGLVQFAMGETDDLTRSHQWLTGQIQCDLSNMKSVALLQITVLHRLNDLIDAEKQRLTRLYEEAQQPQR